MIHEVAIRYARALYEATRSAESKDEHVLNELRAFAEAIHSTPALKDFLVSPAISAEDKQKTLNLLKGKLSDDVLNFIILLAEKGRLEFTEQIEQAFEALIDAQHGLTRGTVRSAAVLDPEQRKNLEETVRKVTGKQVVLTFELDPSLVGGLVAQVGGWTFDDSLATHLTTLEEDLRRMSL